MALSEEEKGERGRAAVRKYRASHLEECRAYGRRYHQENREARLEYNRKYGKTHRDSINQTKQEYRASHREQIKEINRRMYEKNREEYLAKVSNYQKTHRSAINARIQERRRTDVPFRMAMVCRQRVRKILKECLMNNVISSTKALGCTHAEFGYWISSQFEEDMTMDNYGTVWQIDHIYPLAMVDWEDKEQRELASHYTNLQPLRKGINGAKGFKLNPEQQRYGLKKRKPLIGKRASGELCFWLSQHAAALDIGVSVAAVNRQIRGVDTSVRGWKFRYIDKTKVEYDF